MEDSRTAIRLIPMGFRATRTCVRPVFALVASAILLASTVASAQPKGLNGFKPPKVIPEHLEFDPSKQLLTESEEKELQRQELTLKKTLRAGSVRGAAGKVIVEGAKHHAFRLSMEKYQSPGEGVKTLGQLRDETLRLSSSGAAREMFLDELKKNCVKMFDNNEIVRKQAVLLLSGLNSQDANALRKIPAIAYIGSLPPLLDFIQDPNQQVGTKIMAVGGISRIFASNTNIDRKLQTRAAQTLADQLVGQDKTHYAYQRKLSVALSDAPYLYDTFNPGRKPIVLDALLATVNNKDNHMFARVAAAKALGDCGLDKMSPADVDLNKICYSIVSLNYDMARMYNAKPLRIWHSLFFEVYLAFKPLNAEAKNKKQGLTTKFNTQIVNDAYRQILPTVNHFFANAPNLPKIPDTTLNSLKTWLEQKAPKEAGAGKNDTSNGAVAGNNE